jgi:peroxiredoxin
MKKFMPIGGFAAILVGVVAALAVFCGAQTTATPAPDFTVIDLKGQTITSAQYKGKVLFLNFWATWCPPCRAEIPDFVDVYAANKAKGMEILGISLDTKEKSEVQAFVQKFKINYPVVLETKKQTEKLLDDFQPGQFIPTTFVIDKKGRIRDKIVRAMDKEEILRIFNRLAAE